MVEFKDVLQEVGLMLSDLKQQPDVVQVGNALAFFRRVMS